MQCLQGLRTCRLTTFVLSSRRGFKSYTFRVLPSLEEEKSLVSLQVASKDLGAVGDGMSRREETQVLSVFQRIKLLLLHCPETISVLTHETLTVVGLYPNRTICAQLLQNKRDTSPVRQSLPTVVENPSLRVPLILARTWTTRHQPAP
jgi:hypothetical protein